MSLSFDDYRRVVLRGLDPHRDPPIFPCIIVASESGVDVNVLQTVPEYGRAHDICAKWLESTLEVLDGPVTYCLAFATCPVSLYLQTNCRGSVERFNGEFNLDESTIEWLPID